MSLSVGGGRAERHPPILLISSLDDFSTDHVVAALRRRKVDYCRLNIEDLVSDEIALDPTAPRLTVETTDSRCVFEPASLRSVYFRGPSFARHYTPEDIHPDELVRRQHGWAFLRSLAVFKSARWVDSPTHVYHAEHKALQLLEATRLGFRVPATAVSNSWRLAQDTVQGSPVAIKPIDTLIFTDHATQGFTYTQLEERRKVPGLRLAGTPCILQQGLANKIDLRVTVVGTRLFAVSITLAGRSIEGDWRPSKQAVQVKAIELPADLARRCAKLVECVGLHYGAIDLATVGDVDYFLELNPMGEWAWLEDTFGTAIPDALAELLVQ